MNKVQEALNDLVESARLLGQTQGKKVYGDYTQEDSRFTVAMYQSIEKHSNIIKSALSDIEKCEPVGELILDPAFLPALKAPLVNWKINLVDLEVGTKLYTSPQPRDWVSLSEAEIYETVDDHHETFFKLARAIEVKLKQLNTTEKG